MGDDKRGALQILDDVCHRERFSGASSTEQDLMRQTISRTGNKVFYRHGLIAFGRKRSFDLKLVGMRHKELGTNRDCEMTLTTDS